MTDDIFNISNSINYQVNSIVSREILKKQAGNVTIFAFDRGQGLSEHKAPFDAIVNVIDGFCGNKNIWENIQS